MPREIITFQFGHYANFVGSHFWNSQDIDSKVVDETGNLYQLPEIDCDHLFRLGKNVAGQETYTPRLIVLDLKGSLNSLKQCGSLYDNITPSSSPSKSLHAAWPGVCQQFREAPTPKNEFLEDLEEEEQNYLIQKQLDANSVTGGAVEGVVSQMEGSGILRGNNVTTAGGTSTAEASVSQKSYNLDEDVSVWSDYLRLHLHPRTVHIINDYCHASDFEPFDVHCFGQNVIKNRDFASSIEDSLHFYVEECDSLQGFQIMVDSGDGFGGIGAEWLEGLSDEYSTKSIFTFGLYDYDPNAKRDSEELKAKYVINSALSFDKLREFSSLYVPMSMTSHSWKLPATPLPLPALRFNSSLRYHTSAILAAALDTATLPYRLNVALPSSVQNWLSMEQVEKLFTSRSPDMNIASLSVAFPFPMQVDQTMANVFNNLSPLKNAPYLRQLTPMVSAEKTVYGQLTCLRGPLADVASDPKTLVNKAQTGEGKKIVNPYEKCSSRLEMLQRYVTNSNGMLSMTPLSSSVLVNQPFATSAPFPSIFKNGMYTPEGLKVVKEGTGSDTVASAPVMSVLESNKGIGTSLENLKTELCSINTRRFFQYYEHGGMSSDEFKDFSDNLSTLSDMYSHNVDT
eukprot:Nk52_evm53s226 gene=Nk52_evmTU53s226